jgi:hypothetical protein
MKKVLTTDFRSAIVDLRNGKGPGVCVTGAPQGKGLLIKYRKRTEIVEGI